MLLTRSGENFKIEESPSDNYIDVSNIENWYKYGFDLGVDYSFVRSQIEFLIAKRSENSALSSIGDISEIRNANPSLGNTYTLGDYLLAIWNGNAWQKYDKVFYGYTLLTDSEKKIAAELKLGNPADHFAQFGEKQVEEWTVQFHTKSTSDRIARLRTAEALIYTRIPQYQVNIMEAIVLGKINLHYLYERFGIRGQEDFHPQLNPSPSIGIMDYVNSVGYFEDNGIRSQDWTVIGGNSIDWICDRLSDILLRGI